MVFSDTTNKQGIVEEIDFILGTNSDSYPIPQKVRNVNRGLDKVASLIVKSDGTWEWDDTNADDFPIATTNLVASQQVYSLPTDLIIPQRVEVKDENGNWAVLEPIDKATIGEAMTEYFDTPAIPEQYDKVANTIWLYPAPNYNSTDGLKVYYQRFFSYFVAEDTTKEPGFAKPFHSYLSYYAAAEYARARKPELLPRLEESLAKYELEIKDHYARRSEDKNTNFKVLLDVSDYK